MSHCIHTTSNQTWHEAKSRLHPVRMSVCVAVCLTMNVTHSGNGSQWSHAKYIKSAGSHFETHLHGSSRYRAVTSLFVHTGQANMSCIMLHLLHEQQQDETRGGEMWWQVARQMLQQRENKRIDEREREREREGWCLRIRKTAGIVPYGSV